MLIGKREAADGDVTAAGFDPRFGEDSRILRDLCRRTSSQIGFNSLCQIICRAINDAGEDRQQQTPPCRSARPCCCTCGGDGAGFGVRLGALEDEALALITPQPVEVFDQADAKMTDELLAKLKATETGSLF